MPAAITTKVLDGSQLRARQAERLFSRPLESPSVRRTGRCARCVGSGHDGASADTGARVRRLARRAARGRGRDRSAACRRRRLDTGRARGRDLPRRRAARAGLQSRDAASSRRERHPRRPALHVDARGARRRRRLPAQVAPRRNSCDQPRPALTPVQHTPRQRRSQRHRVRHPRRRRRAAYRRRGARRPSRSHERGGAHRSAERVRRDRPRRRDARRLRDRGADRLDALGDLLPRDTGRPVAGSGGAAARCRLRTTPPGSHRAPRHASSTATSPPPKRISRPLHATGAGDRSSLPSGPSPRSAMAISPPLASERMRRQRPRPAPPRR